MLPDNYVPRAGDILISKHGVVLFAYSGTDRLRLINFNDRFGSPAEYGIAITSETFLQRSV